MREAAGRYCKIDHIFYISMNVTSDRGGFLLLFSFRIADDKRVDEMIINFVIYIGRAIDQSTESTL